MTDGYPTGKVPPPIKKTPPSGARKSAKRPPSGIKRPPSGAKRSLQRRTPPQENLPQAVSVPQEAPASSLQYQQPVDATEMQDESIDMGLYDDNFAADFNLPPTILKKKNMLIVTGVIFFFGLMIGMMLGGGDNIVEGLRGAVKNPEVPRGRPRCGIAERGQGCVFYLMNNDRRELEAKEFYPLVAQLTGVQKFLIETGNMRYGNVLIKPGHIGMFNVPPVQ